MRGMSASSSSSHSSGVPGVPRVGAVRCYWALLKPRYDPNPDPGITVPQLELEFVHFDPILDAHLSKQKGSMMARSVLEFIHPHEREQARKDLLGAISADDLQGSVTRVRFARLSQIRTLLGCPPEENEIPADADVVVEDDEYIILDLVLNWVATGLLLAFFHPIRDKDPVANNDPKRANEEWSNWCGTKFMGDDQIEALCRSVTYNIPIAPSTRRPPARVFQLHLLPPDHMTYAPTQLIFSWPPARPAGVPVGPDGLYDASEYCDMMKHVDMDPSQLKAGPGELRTNCTTRYGAHHLVTTEGLHRTVASVFIPYGKLIFACFQTIKAYELPRNQNNYVTQANGWRKGHTHQSGGKMDPAATEHSSNAANRHTEAQNQLQHALAQNHSQSEASQSQHSAIDWSTDSSLLPTRQGGGNGDWDNSAAYELASLGMVMHEPGSQTVSTMSQHQQHQADGSHAASSGTMYSTNVPSSSFYSSSEYGNPLYSAIPSQTQSSTSISSAAQMASTQSSSSTSSATGQRPVHSQSLKGSIARAVQSGGAPPQSSGKSSTRPLVRPPGDVEACVMCGTKESPEWRKNTNGVKDLCNACGLRMARQVAKRDGKQKPRKKREQGNTPSRRESVTKDSYGISGKM
ncbi:hypothetical protein C356_04532 [Cryptococcus neoformans c45]|nr:hypothetical protein C356_04532 [Cryptococcus neoformans var. grubii c45]